MKLPFIVGDGAAQSWNVRSLDAGLEPLTHWRLNQNGIGAVAGHASAAVCWQMFSLASNWAGWPQLHSNDDAHRLLNVAALALGHAGVWFDGADMRPRSTALAPFYFMK